MNETKELRHYLCLIDEEKELFELAVRYLKNVFDVDVDFTMEFTEDKAWDCWFLVPPHSIPHFFQTLGYIKCCFDYSIDFDEEIESISYF